MDSAKFQKAQGLNLPIVTIAVTMAAVVIGLCPGLASWLVYDRTAILNGQIWRMFTGHWVHFSASHLLYDSLALVLAGWMIEAKRLPYFGRLCLLTPWLVSGVLLITDPQLERYGGLSALATAALVYLALFGLHEAGPWRWACITTLLGLAAKIAYETATGTMIFAKVANEAVAVCPLSHVIGALAALVFYVWTTCKSRQPSLKIRVNS